MTVSSTTRKAGPFTGDGVVDTFPFTFKVFSDADVLVVSADADGVESILTIVTDYAVDLNTDQDASPGGDVILNDPLTSGYTMVISSDADETQLTEITNSGGFYPRVINNALDKQTILTQQLSERVSRALKVPITSSDDPDDLVADFVTSTASTVAAAAAAASSASDASDSADAAALSETAAGLSASSASSSASAASGSASAASDSADAAAASETAAAGYAAAGGRPVVHVAKTGNDTTGDGSSGNPYLTISKGVTIAKPHGVVIVHDGDYSAAVSLAGCYGLEIVAAPNERVRILRGELLGATTATGGRTGVYQRSLSYDPIGYVWEHENPDPDSEIVDADRLPQQRGEQYRLPSTRLHAVASVALVEAATGGAYYWDSGTTTLYVRTPDGSDPDTNGETYYIPANAAFYGCTGNESVRISDIDIWYASSGVNMTDSASVVCSNVFVFGSRQSGFLLDDCRDGLLVHCRAAGCGYDGVSMHQYVAGTADRQLILRMDSCWSHDNLDDGIGTHQNTVCSLDNCLAEYNTTRGVAIAYGGHAVCDSSIANSNGTGGFAVVGASTAPDDGIGTQLLCVSCVADDNQYNYLAQASGNSLRVMGCVSRDATSVGYYATTSATVTLSRCTSDGDAADTGSATGGSIVVNTATEVTP